MQVIIRVDGIELIPENPEYPGGKWELKGMKNEHVVAVGVFSYDVENVSESRIEFRQETDVSPIHTIEYILQEMLCLDS
jgi:hypothetical protein